MRTLLVLALLVGAGILVYVKFIRSSPEQRITARVQALCGDTHDMNEFKDILREAKGEAGEAAMARASDCIDGAGSCAEAVGCLVGATEHATENGYNRGYQRAQ